MLLLQDFNEPIEGMNPGSAGLGDCESLFTFLKTKALIAEKNQVRHFLRIQRAYWRMRIGGCDRLEGELVA